MHRTASAARSGRASSIRTASRAGTVAAPGVSNCFYVDFPAQKIRLLMLNTVDLPFSPRPDGTLKYYTINDHGFS